ncbi:hypothetical protein [Leptospira mayottensis]|uniref:Uncharacterized protein n=1 Tax=Leptospira mayottensis 200901122 TaxID=1193010 RepID=A0AA87SW10_9LEPT|nr:hypothetical protein [Leptospira mayottensis]EKR99403.1 hypothetical protein LEP1GSC125_0485 [Leptospira mayottensis 200901122]
MTIKFPLQTRTEVFRVNLGLFNYGYELNVAVDYCRPTSVENSSTNEKASDPETK